MACRSSGTPAPGGYWLPWPAMIAAAVDVGEALAEVDRPGGDGERRHLGEDRGSHPGEPGVEQWSVHPDMTSCRRAGRHAATAGVRCGHARRSVSVAGQP